MANIVYTSGTVGMATEIHLQRGILIDFCELPLSLIIRLLLPLYKQSADFCLKPSFRTSFKPSLKPKFI